MNILMVTPDGFPPDIRIEREARTLIKAGHRVTLACPKQQGQPEQEDFGGMDVRYLTLPDRRFDKMLEYAYYRSGLSSAANPAWLNVIDKLVTEKDIKAIHVHNLPLVQVASMVAKSRNLRLISDLHELYPENIEASYPWLKGRIMVWAGRWRERERQCLRDSDHVIVVPEALKDDYVKKYHVSPQKITVIGGMIDLDEFYGFPLNQEIVDQFRDRFTIVYAGGYAPYRGLETLVRAFVRVLPDIPTAHLLLVGPHPLSVLASGDSSLTCRVTITGFVDYSLFRSYLSASKIAVYPLLVKNKQMDYACPNKIFQYMASGVATVVPRTSSFQKYIADTGAGILFRSGEDKDLARAIVTLCYDKALRWGCAQKGVEAVKYKYNWAIESKKLLEIYQ